MPLASGLPVIPRLSLNIVLTPYLARDCSNYVDTVQGGNTPVYAKTKLGTSGSRPSGAKYKHYAFGALCSRLRVWHKV